MKRDSLLAALALTLAAAAGCYTGGDIYPMGGGGGASGTVTPTTTTSSTTPATGDLPCDVAQVLTACTTCHGSPLTGGATVPLLTHDDLAAPSLSDPSQSVAQLSIARMQSTKSPMPPTGIPPASDTAVLQAWVTAGMPKGTCGGGGTDGGTAAGGSYNTPSVCTSGTTYTRGENTAMRPGGTCISCHSGGEGPRYSIAGTVYPTAHEPDNCNGDSDPSVQVVITDASGKTITLSTNSAGNFETNQAVATPYTAKVISGTKVRAMATPQTSGDCNSCHTEKGTSGAPGRVMAP